MAINAAVIFFIPAEYDGHTEIDRNALTGRRGMEFAWICLAVYNPSPSIMRKRAVKRTPQVRDLPEQVSSVNERAQEILHCLSFDAHAGR